MGGHDVAGARVDKGLVVVLIGQHADLDTLVVILAVGDKPTVGLGRGREGDDGRPSQKQSFHFPFSYRAEAQFGPY